MSSPAALMLILGSFLVTGGVPAQATEVLTHRITVSVTADGRLSALDHVELSPGGRVADLTLGAGFDWAETPSAQAPLSWLGPVSPRGVILRGEAGWYPRGSEEVSRFRLQAGSLPEGWTLVAPAPGQTAAGVPLLAGPWRKTQARHRELSLSVFYLSKRQESDLRRLLARVGRQIDALTARIGPFPFSEFSLVEHPLAGDLHAPGLAGLTPQELDRLIDAPRAVDQLVLGQWWGQGVIATGEDGAWVEGIARFLTEPGFSPGAGAEARAQTLRRIGYDNAEAARAESSRRTEPSEAAALTLLELSIDQGEDRVLQALRELFARKVHSPFRREDLRGALAGVLGRARLGDRLAQGARMPVPELGNVPANLARCLDYPPELVVVSASRGRRMELAARGLAGQLAEGKVPVVSSRDLTAERLNRAERVWLVSRPGAEVIRRTGMVLPHDLQLGDQGVALGGLRRAGRSAGLAVALEHGTPGEGVICLLDGLSFEALEAAYRAIDPNRSYGWLLLDSASGVEYGLANPLETFQPQE